MTETPVSIDVSRPWEGMPIIEGPAFQRRIAPRHEKPAVDFPGCVHLAATIDWISHDV